MAQAEELGKLAEYVGGPEYAYLLLPPLEKLTAVDEETVRGKVIGWEFLYAMRMQGRSALTESILYLYYYTVRQLSRYSR